MEYKIYNVQDPAFINYICRGALCDALWDLSCPKEKIYEDTLIFEDNLASLDVPFVTVYQVLYCPESSATKHHGIDNPLRMVAQRCSLHTRRLVMHAAKRTPWFTDEAKALEAARDWNCDDNILLFQSSVNMTVIPKIEFPIYEFLSTSSDGKRAVRLNLHPEWDGNQAPGMICFLDRSCKDLPDGKIVITSVKEFKTYGFIKAEPCKETDVLDSSCVYQFGCYLRDQIKNETLSYDTPLCVIESPVRGRYVAHKEDYYDIYTRSHKTIYHVYDKFDSRGDIVFSHKLGSLLVSDIECHTSREVQAETLAAECIFSKYGGADAIQQRCQESESIWYRNVSSSNNLSAEIISVQMPNITQLMNDAYNVDLLDMYAWKSSGIEFISFINANLNSFIYFSGEEIDEIFNTVKKFNEKADRRVNMISKKYKLSLTKM